jgi:hypothetical protein
MAEEIVIDNASSLDEIINSNHDLIIEDYIPEELDDLHEYLYSAQTITFNREEELNDFFSLLSITDKNLLNQISSDEDYSDYSGVTAEELDELCFYSGNLDHFFITRSYLRYIKNGNPDNILMRIDAAEKSKNMPDILKSKIKPIPELPNYPFKIANSIKYSKMNGTKFTIYENEKSNSICNKVFVLSMNLPYEFYSIIHQADSFYCYDFNINQYYFQEFNNLDLDSIFLKSSKNGINSSIWFKLNMGVPRIEKGVRNLLLALHLKLPTIPVVLFSTNEENQLCYRKLTNEMKYKMNEICNPYFIFK